MSKVNLSKDIVINTPKSNGVIKEQYKYGTPIGYYCPPNRPILPDTFVKQQGNDKKVVK